MDIRKLPGEVHHHGDTMFVHVFDPPREDWPNITRMRFDAIRKCVIDELTPKYERLVDHGMMATEEADAELIHETYTTLARELRLNYLRFHQR